MGIIGKHFFFTNYFFLKSEGWPSNQSDEWNEAEMARLLPKGGQVRPSRPADTAHRTPRGKRAIAAKWSGTLPI
ncbi:hypothetical protein [Rossellomorea marisflavi]|uniref:hypothetical protein n=1 Tax=Rossellomorea marisflavi TaxID=189381 RepID=UPI0034585665